MDTPLKLQDIEKNAVIDYPDGVALVLAVRLLHTNLARVVANHCANDRMFCSTCTEARRLLASIVL